MLIYGALVTVYLAWLGLSVFFVGPLLWPAFVLHTILTVLLARVFCSEPANEMAWTQRTARLVWIV
jgi:hypothetical protein